MKKFVFILVLLANIAYLTAQDSSQVYHGMTENVINGSGIMTFKEFEVATFQKIVLEGRIYRVFISQSEQTSVVVKTDNDLINFVEISVSNGELKADIKANNYKDPEVYLYITMPELTEIRSGLASHITFETPMNIEGNMSIYGKGATSLYGRTISASHMFIELHGASQGNLSLDVQSVDIEVLGTGNIKLTGWAENQNVRALGVSKVNLFSLKGKKNRIEHSTPQSRVSYLGFANEKINHR